MAAGDDRPRGERVLELVEMMDRLRSPGGCPWDAEQTHESLAKFVVEEAYELAEAIADGDRDEMADELGDVLFQVVFHARVAQEDPDAPFDIDDVAGRITAKLRRRHPHVFGDLGPVTNAQIEANWDAIKAQEKPDRHHPLDGIPRGLPPLERAAKTGIRMARAGQADLLREHVSRLVGGGEVSPAGAALLSTAIDAALDGADPGDELRRALLALERSLRAGGPHQDDDARAQ